MKIFFWLFVTLFSQGNCQVDVESFQAYMGRIMDDPAWQRLDHALHHQKKYCHQNIDDGEINIRDYVKMYGKEYDFLYGVFYKQEKFPLPFLRA